MKLASDKDRADHKAWLESIQECSFCGKRGTPFTFDFGFGASQRCPSCWGEDIIDVDSVAFFCACGKEITEHEKETSGVCQECK